MAGPVSTDRSGAIAIVVTDYPPVNALSTAVREGLFQEVEHADRDGSVEAIVIACAGSTFHAGADIREFGQQPRQPFLPDVINRIEACGKPVVAAMHGTTLGGGLEVALGCHYRIAAPGTRAGLPEIKLGLLPGAGGTQRLPRLIGPEAALDFILSGDPVDAQRAFDMGMIDAIARDEVLAEAVAMARKLAAEGAPCRRLSREEGRIEAARRDPAAFNAHGRQALSRKRGFDAPRMCVDAVRNAIELPFGEGLTHERAFFMQLREGPQSAAMRHLFFAERAALKVPGVTKDIRALDVRRAAVIGAGTMGAGIAMCLAEAGIEVLLIDPDPVARERAVGSMRSNWERSASRSGAGIDRVEQQLSLVRQGSEPADAANADLVIEAVFEDLELKKRIFHELDLATSPDAILATNTSTLDVNAIASATARPQSVLGMHFFSPANVMRLLEVVRADATSPEALKTAIETGRRLRKMPVTVGVCHGFVGNRMLYARSAQVEALLLQGISPSALDKALTDFGFAMGPCAVSDLAGLDVGWRARKQAGRQAIVADTICEMGRFGQKTGAGYFRYPDGSRRGEADPEIEAVIRQLADERGIEQVAMDGPAIFERLVYAMINEGARILEEGIALRSSDIDLIWVNGYGWPAYEGGPMFYADRVGIGRVATSLQAMADTTGDESLRPAPLLLRLAQGGGRFSQIDEA